VAKDLTGQYLYQILSNKPIVTTITKGKNSYRASYGKYQQMRDVWSEDEINNAIKSGRLKRITGGEDSGD